MARPSDLAHRHGRSRSTPLPIEPGGDKSHDPGNHPSIYPAAVMPRTRFHWGGDWSKNLQFAGCCGSSFLLLEFMDRREEPVATPGNCFNEARVLGRVTD